MAAAEKRRLFALKKADQALSSFEDGKWNTGLAKARAALDLLDGVAGVESESISLVCGGVCLALAATACICEALEFYSSHAAEIADPLLKDQLLQLWVADANALTIGDLVQLSGAGGAQLVGVVLKPCSNIGKWLVRVTGCASEASAAAGPGEMVLEGPKATEAAGDEIEVDESNMTLLTLRLSEEQRQQWRDLVQQKPVLFGQRMSSDNEARWQRLFGAAARSQCAGGAAGVGAGACAASADLGLPLEQSFAATLHGLILEWLACFETSHQTDVSLDLLGCRPALELESPEAVLQQLLEALPDTIRQLKVRMCGPEVGCDQRSSSQELNDGRTVSLQINSGLYHEVFPDAEADLVVAMNAGIGVPQYTGLWGPTLDLLKHRKRPGIFAVTSYTPGELLREVRLLQERWADSVSLEDLPAELQAEFGGSGPASLTLAHEICAPTTSDYSSQLKLERGDVIKSSGSGSVRILRRSTLLYVGPNQTPGRNRNYGKLVLRVGSH
eukprot:TRINITY_DN44598_c0_g1_i1.p1 TRINITY_DN44598_c0_g1~~TRINITY_DN44598_c0_g1_i1.p1  ORF type:complete len:519 (+),score=120.51 TRINITY_DN44598_c0_g1_i1:56-1558(+)